MRHGAQNYNNMNYKNTMNVASVSTASRQTQYKPGLDYDNSSRGTSQGARLMA